MHLNAEQGAFLTNFCILWMAVEQVGISMDTIWPKRTFVQCVLRSWTQRHHSIRSVLMWKSSKKKRKRKKKHLGCRKNDQAYKHYHSVKTHLSRKGGPFSSSSKHFELESFLKDLSEEFLIVSYASLFSSDSLTKQF